MFLKKSHVEEIEESLENNLNTFQDPCLAAINQYLVKAANLLDEVGMEKEANLVTNILEELNDPSVKGLTDDKMVENLKEHGWLFNSTDDHSVTPVQNDLEAAENLEVDDDNLEVDDPAPEMKDSENTDPNRQGSIKVIKN